MEWLEEDSDALERLSKRRRLSGPAEEVLEVASNSLAAPDSEDEDHDCCAICLNKIEEQAWVMPCTHRDFCLDCISSWCTLSRRCPLCNASITELLSHVRSDTDYQTIRLLPLPESQPQASSTGRPYSEQAIRSQLNNRHSHPRLRYRISERAKRSDLNAVDEAALQLQRRRHVYHNRLFAKHIGNGLSRFRSFTPEQFSASPEFKARIIRFVRRELLVFPQVDTEFLTSYVVSIMQSLDLKSESAIRLLSEFLGQHAEHFAHEVYSFARSPYSDPRKYDAIAVYDRPPSASAAPHSSADASRPQKRRRSPAPRKPANSSYRADSYRPSYNHDRYHERRRSRPICLSSALEDDRPGLPPSPPPTTHTENINKHQNRYKTPRKPPSTPPLPPADPKQAFSAVATVTPEKEGAACESTAIPPAIPQPKDKRLERKPRLSALDALRSHLGAPPAANNFSIAGLASRVAEQHFSALAGSPETAEQDVPKGASLKVDAPTPSLSSSVLGESPSSLRLSDQRRERLQARLAEEIQHARSDEKAQSQATKATSVQKSNLQMRLVAEKAALAISEKEEQLRSQVLERLRQARAT